MVRQVSQAQELVPTPVNTATQTQLEEHLWVLESINGEPALPDVEVTLEFVGYSPTPDVRILRGNTGCNPYNAPYERENSRLKIIGVVVGTESCPPERLMEQEQQYVDILWDVITYAIKDDKLILKSATGEKLVFTLQP
jgi:heat shock protein HslJ